MEQHTENCRHRSSAIKGIGIIVGIARPGVDTGANRTAGYRLVGCSLNGVD
jgi:hypothetical protein